MSHCFRRLSWFGPFSFWVPALWLSQCDTLQLHIWSYLRTLSGLSFCGLWWPVLEALVSSYKEIHLDPHQLFFFPSVRRGNLLFVVKLWVWLCLLLESFVVVVENLSPGENGLKCPCPGLCGSCSRCWCVFEFPTRFLMNLTRNCCRIIGHFPILYEWGKDTVQSGRLWTLH